VHDVDPDRGAALSAVHGGDRLKFAARGVLPRVTV
jgi:hypothetical protein